MSDERFRVGVTRDFLGPDGTISYGDPTHGIGLGLLDEAENVEWEFLAEEAEELRPEQVAPYDAILLLKPRVTAATLKGNERFRLISRFGVGYDNIDVGACTESGVMLTITPDGVRRPVAQAVMTFLFALSHKLLIKDRLIRSGRWEEKLGHMGMGLTGRTLGVVGLGNIGREVFRMAAPLEMEQMAYDPYADRAEAAQGGIELVELERLLKEADFVCICCALTEETRGLIDAERLGLMKPEAYLINVARGPIVDQAALTEVLKNRRIAGAGLDVFEQEPIDPQDEILTLDNVIVTPHALCWTDEAFGGNGRSACRNILDLAAGRVPRFVVNRGVLEHPRFAGLGGGQP